MNFTNDYFADIERVSELIPSLSVLKGRSLMLTGASGLIVSAVADVLFYLNKENEMGMTLYLAGREKKRIEDRFPSCNEGDDYHFVFFDATKNDFPSLTVDYIINGASPADPSSYIRQPVETMLASLVGVDALLRLARQCGCKRFLQISTSEVYGKKDSSLPYSETEYGFVDIMNPRSCYPSAKRAADTLCVAYGAEYGVNTVIVRPGHVYGPSITKNDSRASSQFARLAAEGKGIVMKSEGAQMRSYCYTLDSASAILTVLLNGEKGTAYNISNRNSVISIREMAEAFAKAGNVDLIMDIPTEEEKRGYNMMDNSSLDACRLENLGWRALIDMEEGAIKTLKEL